MVHASSLSNTNVHGGTVVEHDDGVSPTVQWRDAGGEEDDDDDTTTTMHDIHDHDNIQQHRRQTSTSTTSFGSSGSGNTDYMDQCVGKKPNTCAALANTLGCVFSIDERGCFNEFLLSLVPPPDIDVTSILGLALKFFTFSFGVFLSDGSWTKLYYNVDVDECADLCLRSTSGTTLRCLAFNYFPFESPWYSSPWQESIFRGMCELLTTNEDSARLRNEDEGLTDAELFYASHFTNRPFSDQAGYYELRDPRGGGMAQFLGYSGSSDNTATDTTVTSNLWPRSRWGIYHFKAPKAVQMPQCLNLGGTGTHTAPLIDTEYVGGFTPVDDNAQCTGLVTKAQATVLCDGAGGRLCSMAELALLQGRQLGCSLDSYAVWAAEDPEVAKPTDPGKFARCCAMYTAQTDCASYTTNRISFCSSLTNLADCVMRGSGAMQQATLGFGHYVQNIRAKCASSLSTNCRGTLVTDWAPRDLCLWCVKPGNNNPGQCRPGQSYGICPGASRPSRVSFATSLAQHCGVGALCGLQRMYPDWAQV